MLFSAPQNRNGGATKTKDKCIHCFMVTTPTQNGPKLVKQMRIGQKSCCQFVRKQEVCFALQLLEEADRVTISGNRVEVKELERSDGGAYTCTFKNIVGQVSHKMTLVIEGNFMFLGLFSFLFPSLLFYVSTDLKFPLSVCVCVCVCVCEERERKNDREREISVSSACYISRGFVSDSNCGIFTQKWEPVLESSLASAVVQTLT